MKTKKLLSLLLSATIAASAFAGLMVPVSAENNYETILNEDFDAGVSSVVLEANVGSKIAEDNTLKLGGSYETYRLNLAKSYSASETNVFKLTFDAKISEFNRLGVGLGDGDRNNGAYWGFSLIYPDANITNAAKGNLAMGSAWEDNEKLYALTDADGNMKGQEINTWYTVETYLEMPSKKMTTKAWVKSDPSVVYSRTITAPSNGSYNVGGSKGTSISAVRIFSRGEAYIDNVKVERMNQPYDGKLYWADFDTVGSTPAVQVNSSASTSVSTENDNSYLTFGGSWSRYWQAFNSNQAVDVTETCNIETSLDIKFVESSMSGVGLGDSNEGNGSFWIIGATASQGMVIGSVENNEAGKVVKLKDLNGNVPTIDPEKWYHVESKIEFPSKLMTTYVYERDTENATVYLASATAPAAGNYIVGGFKGSSVTGLRYISHAGMSIDNISVEKSVPVVDEMLLGYHPFDYGFDNAAALRTAGMGSNWASIQKDADGNYYMKATKGEAAASGDAGSWRYWTYIPSGATSTALSDYWNALNGGMLKIEFDIRTSAVPTGSELIYFSKMHNHQNGLAIFGMNADSIAMGAVPDSGRAFTEIENLELGKWYHYTYILDIANKRAKAVLSDGINEYSKDWTSLTGSGTGYWKDSLATPFNTLAFQLPGGDIDLDNISFKKHYEAPVVNSNSIVFKSGDEIQQNWTEVSTATDTVIIDFGTAMDESTVNNNSVYVTKKGDTAKVGASGDFVDGKYVLSLTETLSQKTDYELHITTDVENVSGESFGAEDYIASFKTSAGVITATLVDVKNGENTVGDFAAFKALAGQNIKINTTYTNTTGEDGGYYVIVAHYNGAALKNAKIIEVPKTAEITSANDALDYTIPADMSEVTSTNIFLWNNFEELKPLSSPIEY